MDLMNLMNWIDLKPYLMQYYLTELGKSGSKTELAMSSSNNALAKSVQWASAIFWACEVIAMTKGNISRWRSYCNKQAQYFELAKSLQWSSATFRACKVIAMSKRNISSFRGHCNEQAQYFELAKSLQWASAIFWGEINLFHPTGLFLYPLEHRKLSFLMFSGVKKTSVMKWINETADPLSTNPTK